MKTDFKTLKKRAGMTIAEFSNFTNIPVRTLENWSSGRCTPPEYVVDLIAYFLHNEGKLLRYYYVETNAPVYVVVVDNENNAILLDETMFDTPLSLEVAKSGDYSNLNGCQNIEECIYSIGTPFEVYQWKDIVNEFEKIVEF